MKRLAVLIAVLILIAAGYRFAQQKSPSTDPSAAAVRIGVDIPHVGRQQYTASGACRDCHSEQYESWHDSYHRTMTQVASTDSVVAPFDGETVASLGRSFTMTQADGAFYVDMPDPDWELEQIGQGRDLTKLQPPPSRQRVVMTTGSHHLQTYWISSGDGNKLRQLPWVYHIAEQLWMPNESSFLSAPGQAKDILENRHFVYWNYFCINCHSVGGKINLVEKSDWNTRVAELGIACEACHGPADSHVQYHRQMGRTGSSNITPEQAALVNPADCDPKVSSQICGQCHSDNNWPNKENDYVPGGDLLARCNLFQYDNTFEPQRFWGDGTMRVGGREYLPMIESKCFQQGELSCLSCHSMHDSDPDDQLAAGMRANDACVQCHPKYAEDLTGHTHHPADSAGSLCYNCHMPHTTYALFKGIRSHRIDSPSVRISAEHGRPNGCNQCHSDKSLKWTAGHLQQWYEIDSGEIPQLHQQQPASAVWALKGNAVQRAIAAWSYRWPDALKASGDQWQPQILARLLEDPYAAVRFIAMQSLQAREQFQDWQFNYVADPEQRRQAIDALLEIGVATPPEEIPESMQHLFDDNGLLKPQFVEPLLQNRDDSEINISE